MNNKNSQKNFTELVSIISQIASGEVSNKTIKKCLQITADFFGLSKFCILAKLPDYPAYKLLHELQPDHCSVKDSRLIAINDITVKNYKEKSKTYLQDIKNAFSSKFLLVPYFYDKQIAFLFVLEKQDENWQQKQEIIAICNIIKIAVSRLGFKDSEEKLITFSRAIEQSPVCMMISNRFSKVEYVNNYFCEKTGFSLSDIYSNNNFIKEYKEKNKKKFKEISEKLQKGEMWHGEIKIFKKNKQPMWLEAFVSPILNIDGSIKNFLSIGNDISEKKKYQKKIKEKNKQLRETIKQKDDFIARVSHEIRTPLSGVLGMAKLLQDTELDFEQEEYVNSILFSGEVLISVLNEVLDFSKIESGRMKLEKTAFNLKEQIIGISKIAQNQAKSKDLALDVKLSDKADKTFLGDPIKLRQVLNNLISNAVKFTFSGGVFIKVECTKESKRQTTFVFEVSDTGIGMDKRTKNKLFKDYIQANPSVARKYGGTGLGLAISRKIVDLMGGEVKVDSKKGEGSSFWFEITLKHANKKAQEELSQEKDSQNYQNALPLKVLIAEDNRINAYFLNSLANKFGHFVEVVENGNEVVFKALNEEYDLILMDMELPEKDGIDATREIRKEQIKTPIIGLSANTSKEDKEKCIDAGMNDFVTKPIFPRELKNAIINVIPEDKKTKATHDDITLIRLVNKNKISKLTYNIGLKETKSLIKEYVKYAKEQTREILCFCKEKKVKDVGYAAHSFKSASASIGLDDLAKTLSKIEYMGKNSDEEVFPLCNKILQKKVDNSIKELNSFLDSIGE